MNKIATCLVGAAIATAFPASYPVQAENNLKTSGFATIAVSQTDTKYEYTQGEDDNFNFRSRSLAGLQFDFIVNEDTSFAAQLLAEAATDWEPSFSWAFIRYKVTPNTSIRAGRMPVPGYMLADYINVGYAYPWISPPSEMYDSGSDGALDGLDLIFKGSLTDTWSFYVRPYMGSNEENGANIENLYGIEFNMSSENITLSAGYRSASITATEEFELYQLVNAFPSFITSDDYKPEGEHVDFYNVGFSYDNGSLLIMTEYSTFSWDSKVLLPTTNSGYVMAGWRFGKVMPHITYSKMETDEDELYQFPSINGQPNIINTISRGVLDREQNTTTLGVRWDFRPSVALKAEYQRITGFDDGSGLFAPPFGVVMDEEQPDVNLYRIAIAGVF